MKTVFFVVVASVFFTTSSATFDYCSVNCYAGADQPPHIHTMCTYQEEKPGKLCLGFDASKMLKQKDKDAILYLHNELRNKVALGNEPSQPSASNMMELVWDKELEVIARRWALQCIYDHDKCRSTKDKVLCGQNLAVSSVSRGEEKLFSNAYLDQVKGWYSEFSILPQDMIDNFRQRTPEEQLKGMVGHYTQLVWGKSTKLGCERVYFDFTNVDYNPPKHWGMTEYLVCVYLHGNMRSEAIYKKGQPCSACPTDGKCSKSFPGLCANSLAKAVKQPPRTKKPGLVQETTKPPKYSKPVTIATIPPLNRGPATTERPRRVKPPRWLPGGLVRHRKHRKTKFIGWRLRTAATACGNSLSLSSLTAAVLLLLVGGKCVN